MAKMMIGELGNRTGTKVNTIRYYEDIGILPPPVRTDSGRRTYAECDVKRLSFIRHSRSFGFSLAEIRSLLSLSDSPEQDCTLASTIAKSHLERIAAFALGVCDILFRWASGELRNHWCTLRSFTSPADPRFHRHRRSNYQA